MANPVEIITHLGPYEVNEVTSPMLDDLVVRQRVPIIVSQLVQSTRDDTKEPYKVYAVLATKDIKLICSQCFKHGMSITDASRCKTCSSFAKHWEYKKDGNRRKGCKEDSMFMNAPGNCTMVQLQKAKTIEQMTTPESLTDKTLMAEVKKRIEVQTKAETLTDDTDGGLTDFTKEVLDMVDEDVLVKYVKTRGIHTVRGARATQLIDELYLMAFKEEPKVFYGEEKINGRPHKKDYVGCDLTFIPEGKKRKIVVASFKPRTCTDMDDSIEEPKTKKTKK
jgi:hypothetical protein